MKTIPLMQVAILIPAVFYAAFLDWKTRRIPNVLSAFIAIGGVTYLAVEHSMATALGGLTQGVIAGLACMPIYLVRGMSAGDVKLISATSIWWTATQLLIALAATAIVGAILAVIYICATRDATHVPYAMAIATSTIGTALTV
jgi:prepilin peptidase CpaA